MNATSGRINLRQFSLGAEPGVVAAFSDRNGGVSEGSYRSLNLSLNVGDDEARVLENRQRFAGAIGFGLEDFIFCNQVHGGTVREVTRADAGRGATGKRLPIRETDALVTAERGVVLAITLADCMPIVVFDPRAPAVGLAHAGWGGAVRRIGSRTVEAMQAAFSSKPEDLRVGLGPAIGADNFEVGDDVIHLAEKAFPRSDVVRDKRGGKGFLDLRACARIDLEEAGVLPANIESEGIDTYTDEDYFSHRAEGPTGRFAAVAALVEDGQGT